MNMWSMMQVSRSQSIRESCGLRRTVDFIKRKMKNYYGILYRGETRSDLFCKNSSLKKKERKKM